jgi:arylsulfatase
MKLVSKLWLALLVASVGLASCSRLRGDAEPAAVFLIVADTLRPDRLSSYGYAKHETRAMDGLARRGVRFDRAQSVASWTLPSMGSIMTSRYPTQIGLVERPGPDGKIWEPGEKRGQLHYTLPHAFRTLGEIMNDAGYLTAGFINQPFINVEDGFLQGFREWCHTVGERQIRWHDASKPIPTIEYPEGQDPGEADPVLVATFDAWLGRNSDKKPFVWLHLLKTHLPYSPPPRHMPGSGPEDWKTLGPSDYYDAEVRELDELIATIVASIERHVGLDRSLVIFTSDHGEAFNEHGEFEHGQSLHREVVHVPLIFAGPKVPPGKTVAAYVRTTDILPTILDLAGLTAMEPRGTEGASLVPLFERGGVDRPVYMEGMLYGGTERSLTSGGYKLLFDGQHNPPYRLFHLDEDPWETADVSRQRSAKRDAMQQALTVLYDRLLQEWKSGADSDSPAVTEVDESVRRSIRALGYVSK